MTNYTSCSVKNWSTHEIFKPKVVQKMSHPLIEITSQLSNRVSYSKTMHSFRKLNVVAFQWYALLEHSSNHCKVISCESWLRDFNPHTVRPVLTAFSLPKPWSSSPLEGVKQQQLHFIIPVKALNQSLSLRDHHQSVCSMLSTELSWLFIVNPCAQLITTS